MSKEFIKLAAGLMMTITLIAVGYTILEKVGVFSDHVVQIGNKTIQSMEEAEITRYDQSVIQGTQVVGYINSIKELVPNVKVKTLDEPEGFYVVQNGFFVNSGDSIAESEVKGVSVKVTPISKLKDIDETNFYIKPLGTFKVEVERNGNGVISNVEITQKT
jgi:hypothetical protein